MNLNTSALSCEPWEKPHKKVYYGNNTASDINGSRARELIYEENLIDDEGNNPEMALIITKQ